MSSPVDGPIDARVELFYDGQWNDVSDDAALETSAISISYGQPDEHGSPTPTELSLVLDNVDYDSAALLPKYSPLDPHSTLYGKIGMGSLIRVRIGEPQSGGLVLPGHRSGYVSTPDTGALDITGDIDIRMELEPDTWRPVTDPGAAASADFIPLARKDTAGYPTVNQMSWVLYLTPTGGLLLNWSVTGTTLLGASSTAVIPEDTGRLAVRCTLDVADGANKTVRFYTADTIAGPWTQLGAAVTTAGNTSIFSSSSDLELGRGAYRFDSPNVRALRGHVYAFELRDGIDGTLVADVDFEDTGLDPQDREVVGDDGLTWTLQGGSAIVDYSVRGAAAIARFSPTWDQTALDRQMEITAYGPLEAQSTQDPLASALTRNLLGVPTLVAYWPMEDRSAATVFASAISGHLPMSIVGDVSPAGYSELDASSPLPTFASPSSGTSSAAAVVPDYTPEDRQRLVCIVGAPEGGVSAESRLLTYRSTGSAPTWAINIDTDGSLRMLAYDNLGSELVNQLVSATLNGAPHLLSLLLEQNGTDVDWELGDMLAGDDSFGSGSGTLANRTVGRVNQAHVGPSATLSGTAVGHLAILNGQTQDNSTLEVFTLFEDTLRAWSGDTAGDRIERLAAEEGLALQMIGGHESVPLGPQLPTQLFDLFDESIDAEIGFVGERRDANAYWARFRETLYDQAPALVLDMDDGMIPASLSPPLDTQSVRNDVTVTRRGGSSHRAVQEAGPLSVQPPPAGIGKRRPQAHTLNLHTDDDVRDQATWRLHLGTVNEHRISRLEIEMEHHPELVDAVLRLQVGDIIRIDNAVRGLPPSLLLMALGTQDVITDQTWTVAINCAPGSPWTVGKVSDGVDEQRLDTDGSEVYQPVGTSDTTVLVEITDGPEWTTGAGEFPIPVTIGGEEVSVTDIAGPDSDHRFANDRETVNNEVAHVAPSVTPVRDDAVLICAWCTFDTAGTYTVPASMTEHAQTSESFSTLADATEVVDAGATGTRTATFSASDRWAAVSDSYDAEVPVTVEEKLSGSGTGNVTLTTSPGTRSGWFLVAIHAWDEDGAGAMAAPTGPSLGTWGSLNDTGASAATARIRVWALEVVEDGAQEVTFVGGGNDNHARLYVVSGQYCQRFTVTRSENGVVKSHARGTDVRLTNPIILGL